MVDFEEFIEGHLQHAYASKYYDPVKAHEYYLRTRELKGDGKKSSGEKAAPKRPVKALGSKAKREMWRATKDQIGKAKKFETKALSSDRKTQTDAIRAQAKIKRERISAKLAARLKIITTQTTNKRQTLSAQKKAQLANVKAATDRRIAAVPEIPKGLSKEARAKASADRAAKIAAIRGDANKVKDKLYNTSKASTTKLSNESRWNKAVERNSAKQEREALAFYTKASVNRARAEWNAKKEQIKAKYEAEYDREFESIKRS